MTKEIKKVVRLTQLKQLMITMLNLINLLLWAKHKRQILQMSHGEEYDILWYLQLLIFLSSWLLMSF